MIGYISLRSILHYDPETGEWTWLVNRARLAKAGQKAGTPHQKEGYIRLHIQGRMYQSSILAHFYMTGLWPEDEMDHINGIRDDDRWANLRSVSKQKNLLNRKRYLTSTSGHKGVSWHSKLGKWRARIQLYGKRMALGCFGTKEEASAAYEAAAAKHFGEFARGHHLIKQERKKA